MTAIRGYVAPTKDGDALGVHSLDQFVLAVPDAHVAQEFYGNFGLDLACDGNTLAIKTFGHAHRWGSVVEGSKAKPQSTGCRARSRRCRRSPRPRRSRRSKARSPRALAGVRSPR